LGFPPARPASLGEAGEADQPSAEVISNLDFYIYLIAKWRKKQFFSMALVLKKKNRLANKKDGFNLS